MPGLHIVGPVVVENLRSASGVLSDFPRIFKSESWFSPYDQGGENAFPPTKPARSAVSIHCGLHRLLPERKFCKPEHNRRRWLHGQAYIFEWKQVWFRGGLSWHFPRSSKGNCCSASSYLLMHLDAASPCADYNYRFSEIGISHSLELK